MAAQLHNISEFEQGIAEAQVRTTAIGKRARIYPFPEPVSQRPRQQPKPNERAGAWLRGFRFALRTEVAGSLLIFGFWLLWHFSR